MSGKRLTRLVVGVAAAVAFFVSWAAIAARPWQARSPARSDPRLAALAAREQRLRDEAKEVDRLIKHRWTEYRHALKKRQHAIAAARRAHARELEKARLAAARAQIVSFVPAAAPATIVKVAPSSAPPVVSINLPPVKPVTSTKSS